MIDQRVEMYGRQSPGMPPDILQLAEISSAQHLYEEAEERAREVRRV